MPNNVGNLGKIIVATGFEWLPKVQKIAQSGHTGTDQHRCPKEDARTNLIRKRRFDLEALDGRNGSLAEFGLPR